MIHLIHAKHLQKGSFLTNPLIPQMFGPNLIFSMVMIPNCSKYTIFMQKPYQEAAVRKIIIVCNNRLCVPLCILLEILCNKLLQAQWRPTELFF